MLSRYLCLNEAPGLAWASGAFRKTHLNLDLWTEILSWLPMVAPGQFQTSDQEQLAISLRRVERGVRIPSHLFAQNYQRRYEIACLLDAVLNADPVAVKQIFKRKDSAAIKAMLSTSGTSVIAHLGIERMGTPLQMALYSHDEKMFELIAGQMDPEEVQQQCQKVFNDCGVCDYSALIKEQKKEANRLCGELEGAFHKASPTDITNALEHVPDTTSALQDTLKRFNSNLDRYVKANPVHNPYILRCLFEIFDRLSDGEYLISQQAIGLAQKLSSAQWLQHYAQGIYYLRSETPSREFSCRLSTPPLDIRSLSQLGFDSCIDIDGAQNGMAVASMLDRSGKRLAYISASIKTFIKQKEDAWEPMLQVPHAEPGCAIQ
jgi:hypothetical protein